MANISTYPIGTPSLEDLIPGTQKFTAANGKKENLTRNFTVSDLSSLATNNYVETTLTLTAAQMRSLHTGAIQLLPSPGGTKVIKLLTVSTYLDSDTRFTSVGSAGIDIVFATNVISVQARIPILLYTGTNDYVGNVITPFESIGGIWTLPLMVYSQTAILLGGTSTFSIKVRYQVLDTSAF